MRLTSPRFRSLPPQENADQIEHHAKQENVRSAQKKTLNTLYPRTPNPEKSAGQIDLVRSKKLGDSSARIPLRVLWWNLHSDGTPVRDVTPAQCQNKSLPRTLRSAEHLGDTAEKWRQEKLGMSKAKFHLVEKAK
jgi:hypothetical protein